MDISLVIPIYNEEESLPELTTWIDKVMKKNNFSFEIIMVNDGSSDGSWQVIENLKTKHPEITGVKFRRNFGKAAALNVGFQRAKGDVVITMDADLQDSPDEIPGLYQMVKKEGFDMISGWKKVRHDPIGKTFPSKIWNGAAKMMSGIKLHDFNCGLKAYANPVIKSIEVYGEMHRYIPILAKIAGFGNIGEKIVEHRSRKYGTSKYGFERFMKGFLDLMTITFISRFGKSPMHFFGALGSLMFIIGFVSAGWLGGQKLYLLSKSLPNRLITESPYFYLALTTMIIGMQLFMTGFLGELIIKNNTERNQYDIEKEI